MEYGLSYSDAILYLDSITCDKTLENGTPLEKMIKHGSFKVNALLDINDLKLSYLDLLKKHGFVDKGFINNHINEKVCLHEIDHLHIGITQYRIVQLENGKFKIDTENKMIKNTHKLYNLFADHPSISKEVVNSPSPMRSPVMISSPSPVKSLKRKKSPSPVIDHEQSEKKLKGALEALHNLVKSKKL